ncbi:hypothetical protein ACHWQZ_G002783 [Mnemiopsis leidyi]
MTERSKMFEDRCPLDRKGRDIYIEKDIYKFSLASSLPTIRDKTVDFVFAGKVFEMYICSGSNSWVDNIQDKEEKISEFFALKQVFRLLSEKLCDKGNYVYKTNTINIKGYKVWFGNKSKAARQNISRCIENGLVNSMKLSLCCKESSKRLTTVIFRFFNELCNDKDSEHTSSRCVIIGHLVRPEVQNLLHGIIESLNICDGNCPAKITSKKTSQKSSNNHHVIKMRQFDQFICGESSDEIWEDMLNSNTIEGEDYHMIKFGIAASVFRKPVCCLL